MAESKQQGQAVAGGLSREQLAGQGVLVGVSSAAALLGLSHGRVGQLMRSGSLPPEDFQLAEGSRIKPLWLASTLLEWQKTR